MKSLVTAVFILILFILAGCGHRHRHKHFNGTADVSSNSDLSIHNVILEFWTGLSEEEKAVLLADIRREVIMWETTEEDKIPEVKIDIVINNEITNNIEVEVDNVGIIVGCKRQKPFGIPPGHLHKYFCEWRDKQQKKKCKKHGNHDDHDHD